MAAPLSPSVPRALAKRYLRILYADDVLELRELALLTFSRDGHGIECVSDGAAAYDRLAVDHEFDLAITDHHMPKNEPSPGQAPGYHGKGLRPDNSGRHPSSRQAAGN